MIKINLLIAREDIKESARKKEVTIFVLVILLVLAGIGIVQWMSSRQREEITAQIKNTRDELARLEAVKQEINKAKANKKILEEKLHIIQSLNQNRTRPIQIMSVLASKIPEKMWLNSLDRTAEKLTLEGIALDDETIANFMTRLQQAGMFTSVELVVTERMTVEDVKLKKFTVICMIMA